MDKDYTHLLASFAEFKTHLDYLEETQDWDQVEEDANNYDTLLKELRTHVKDRVDCQRQVEQASTHYHDIIRSKGGGPHEDLRRGYDTTTLSQYYAAKQELVRLALARDQAGVEAMRVATELARIQEEHGRFAISVAASFRGHSWRAEKGFP